MKLCSDCHDEVEPGWQYCHTCGAIAMSTVYRIVGDDAPSADSALPGSAFMALLEGRPTAPADQVYVDDVAVPAVPAMRAATALATVDESSAAAAAASLTSALPLTPHVLPQRADRSPLRHRLAVVTLAAALLAVAAVALQLNSDLAATRARLQRTQGELDSAREAGVPGK